MAHSTTDRWFDALGDALTEAGTNEVLRAWMDGAGHLLGDVDELIRDTDDGPGWSIILDPTRAPDYALPWLAMVSGTRVTAGASAAQRRDEIVVGSYRRRGTRAEMIAAVASTLTGTRSVTLVERDGHPYRVRVQTQSSETPDQARTLAVALAAKPAGLVLELVVQAGPSWDEVNAGTTWDTVDPGLTWDDVADLLPGEL